MERDLELLAKRIFRRYERGGVGENYCLSFIDNNVTEDNVTELLSLVPEKLMPSVMYWISRMPDEASTPLVDASLWPVILSMKRWFRTQIAHGVQVPQFSERLDPPEILELTRDSMRVDGVGQGDGFMIWPGGAELIEVDASIAAVLPRIDRYAVEELLDRGSEVVVLSTGMHGRIQIAAEALDFLKSRGVPVHVAENQAAVDTYMGLVRARVRVGAILYRIG